MAVEKGKIEIPLLLVKESFFSRERWYKCSICHVVVDRMFKFEDHWLKHLPGWNDFKGDQTDGFDILESSSITGDGQNSIQSENAARKPKLKASNEKLAIEEPPKIDFDASVALQNNIITVEGKVSKLDFHIQNEGCGILFESE